MERFFLGKIHYQSSRFREARIIMDFKRTLDMWHIPSQTNKKVKTDKELQFAEEVASFANSTGGVLLIGITDTPPRQTEGIGDNTTEVERKLKYTREVTIKYIDYPRDLLHFQLIKVRNFKGEQKNCLVIAIKQSSEVVAVKDKEGRFTYPLRQETGFDRVALGILWAEKLHLKSDNFDFLARFDQMINDR